MCLNNIAAVSVAMILSFGLLSACSSGSSGEDNNTDNTSPPPSLKGVLLLGADDDIAITKTLLMSPTPVDPSQIKTGGLLSTRLDAVINPAATVAEVNTALESVGAKINGMTASDPTVVLSIPEIADRAAAQLIADTLQSSNAFFFVTVAFEAKPQTQNAGNAAKSFLPSPLGFNIQSNISSPFDWFQASRFTPLFSAYPVATAVNQPVIITMPSYYAASTTTDSSNIPILYFLDGVVGSIFLTNYGDDELDPVWGSYGYSIASLIGIDDSTSLNSAYPDTHNNLLGLDAAPLTGLSYTAIVMAIFQSTKDSIADTVLNHKYILLTQHVYEDDDFSERDRTWRAIDALNWRRVGGGFLHVTSVGELGESTGAANQAKYSSPFAISEAYPNLSTLISEDPALNLLSAALADFFDLRYSLGDPSPIGNLLIVGSSQMDGFTRSDFSTPGADVRMIGEDVTTGCYTVSENCVDSQWVMSDTGVAAAQIAGLAAWMLNMDSTLNETGVMTVIKYAYQNGQLVGIVDAYAALLSLDTSITEAPIRKSILGVADTAGTGVRDGLFDEGDISFWLNTILPTYPDGHPRDLNGDGHIGGSDTAWFDLDINALPVYTTVAQTIGDEEISFNEEAITDFDVLCYYAYSDLYTGDEEQRDALLLSGCTSGQTDSTVEFGEFSYSGSAFAACGSFEDGTYVSDGDGNNINDEVDVSGLPAALTTVNRSVSASQAFNGDSATSSLNLASNIQLDQNNNILEISNTGTMSANTNSPGQSGGCWSIAGFGHSYSFNVYQNTNFTLSGTLTGASTAGEVYISNASGVRLVNYNLAVGNISTSGVLTPDAYRFIVACEAAAITVASENTACDVTLTFD